MNEYEIIDYRIVTLMRLYKSLNLDPVQSVQRTFIELNFPSTYWRQFVKNEDRMYNTHLVHYLRHVKQFSVAEIAKYLNLTRNTVYYHLKKPTRMHWRIHDKSEKIRLKKIAEKLDSINSELNESFVITSI